MDESTQQIIALGLVALAIAAELYRRYRKKQSPKAGCDGCGPKSTSAAKPSVAPLQFYERKK